jgi:transcription-repair coupling factor (superfamily II helicase)
MPEGMESLIPLLINDLQLISQSMPESFETIFIERERVVGRIADLLATNEEFREAAWSNAAVGGKVPIEADSTYIDWDTLNLNLPVVKDFRQFGSDEDQFLEIDPIEPFRGNSDRLISILETALNERNESSSPHRVKE